jgi:hypothetical protein
MEFKYMAVGMYLYGNVHELYPGQNNAPEFERKVTHSDIKSGIEYTFESNEL